MAPRADLQERYDHYIWSSDRWDGFDLRDDDIFICTAYKAGTTWPQRICSLLVFQTPNLERPLTTYSPWLEMRAQPVEVVRQAYAAQPHRRFIKTHSPLPALPWSDTAAYLFVARDPRDIFIQVHGFSIDLFCSICTGGPFRAMAALKYTHAPAS